MATRMQGHSESIPFLQVDSGTLYGQSRYLVRVCEEQVRPRQTDAAPLCKEGLLMDARPSVVMKKGR